MTLGELVKSKREEIVAIAERHGARKISLFGSVAREQAGPDSDVDFLVEVEAGRSLLDLGRMLMDLEDLLGCKVDLVEPEGLHWYIRERVLAEAVPV